MRSAGLMLLALHLHAATALLALRLAPPPLHRPVEARLAVARAAGIACMVEEPEALLVGDKWTEAGFESVQGIMGVCKRLNQKRAEAEHLAISLLRDERTMASRVVQAP